PQKEFAEFLNSIATHDSLLHKLWPVISLLTTRTAGDHKAMPLPKPLWGIYYLTRPFRLARKAIGMAVEAGQKPGVEKKADATAPTPRASQRERRWPPDTSETGSVVDALIFSFERVAELVSALGRLLDCIEQALPTIECVPASEICI